MTLYTLVGGFILLFLGCVHWLAVAIQSRRTIEENNDSDSDSDSENYNYNYTHVDYSDILPPTVVPIIQGEVSYEFGSMFIKSGIYSMMISLSLLGILRFISVFYTYSGITWSAVPPAHSGGLSADL